MRHFIVSTRRMLLTSGVFVRTVTLLPLRRITDLTWQETFFGQILGYGTFRFESAGQRPGALGSSPTCRTPTTSTGRSARCCSRATRPAGATASGDDEPADAAAAPRRLRAGDMARHDTEPIPGLPPRRRDRHRRCGRAPAVRQAER